MKAVVCQTDIFWENAAANLDNVERLVAAQDDDVDLIIFPEMFLSGFSMNPEVVAIEQDGAEIERLREIAKRHSKAIMGSLPVINRRRDGSFSYVNRLIFIAYDGTILTYDKRHLFSFGGEDEVYEAGKGKCIIHYKGVRILPLICYDLRFPVWSRCRGEYDMLVYVACWPDSRIDVWRTLLKARAIENQCFVIGANRVGTEPTAVYSGHSMAFDYKGRLIGAAKEGVSDCFAVEIDASRSDSFRRKFPALKDADDFSIDD